MGDRQEASVRQTFHYLAGRSCTPITAGATTQSAQLGRNLLTSLRPDTVQRESPGCF
jgi:hypothetical protein